MMYYYTRYQAYLPRKNAKKTENKLIDVLKQKYPYFKKDEIVMLVNIIDNLEYKDVIYEQFGIKETKAKKVKSSKKKEILKKIKDVVNKKEILDLI